LRLVSLDLERASRQIDPNRLVGIDPTRHTRSRRRGAGTRSAGSRPSDAALEDHHVTPITHREREGIDSVVLDIRDRDSIADALSDQDSVVHLAGNPSPGAAWKGVLDVNIDGTRNVFEATVEHDLDRVVFASTNHVSQMHNIGDIESPETLREDASPVTVTDPVRPDSYYAVSKVAGEATGSFYADYHGIEVVNLRIGWLLTTDELREKQADEEDVARYARAMWLSPRDCRNVIGAAVETDLTESPVTVNAVSRNQDRYLSLIEAIRTLGYEPQDDSSEVLAE